MIQYSRPESVLVVIYTCKYDCLLLERVKPNGFWQSVTGTMQWSETPEEAASREVYEETGLDLNGLQDAKIKKTFRILPEWQYRYAEGVKHNTEHLWYLKIPTIVEVTLNSNEHVSYCWESLEKAILKVTSWTNRDALKHLRKQQI